MGMSDSERMGEDLERPRQAVEALYLALLDAWNRRNAADYAGLFAEDCNVVGFDGSQLDGRQAIETELKRIFADHITATYIGLVREVRELRPGVALLRAVAGMLPPGKDDINPDVNTIQSLVAVQVEDGWQVALFHNTPAQFHDRPEDVQALTAELRALLPGGSVTGVPG